MAKKDAYPLAHAESAAELGQKKCYVCVQSLTLVRNMEDAQSPILVTNMEDYELINMKNIRLI